MDEFSSLEIQFIRASLKTKTEEQIAAFLERPFEEVKLKIEELRPDCNEEKPEKSLMDMDPEDLIVYQKKREQKPYDFFKHKDY